jgi:hypothetical protein
MFIERVMQFHKMDPCDLQLSEATLIFEEYLKEGSMYELNINRDASRTIESVIRGQNVPSTLFDDVLRDIEFLITDPIMRFLASDEYVNSLSLTEQLPVTPTKPGRRRSLVDVVSDFLIKPKNESGKTTVKTNSQKDLAPRDNIDVEIDKKMIRPKSCRLTESVVPRPVPLEPVAKSLPHHGVLSEARRSLRSTASKLKLLLGKPHTQRTQSTQDEIEISPPLSIDEQDGRSSGRRISEIEQSQLTTRKERTAPNIGEELETFSFITTTETENHSSIYESRSDSVDWLNEIDQSQMTKRKSHGRLSVSSMFTIEELETMK